MADIDLLLKAATIVAPTVAGLIGGWALIRKQTEKNEKDNEALAGEFKKFVEDLRTEQKDIESARRAGIEALSQRIDTKFEKIVATLSSVQNVAEESMRQVRAAWDRIEEDGKAAAHERETRARIEEQLAHQKELLADLKRTQELRLDDVRRMIGEHNA